MSQNELILAALKRGDRLTAIDALNRFKCMRLASRISDLKAKGYTIYTHTIKDGDKAYAQYYMTEPKDLFEMMGLPKVTFPQFGEN